MFLDELAKLMELEFIDENNINEYKDLLYTLYQKNIEYMRKKDCKSGIELFNLFKIEQAPERKFFLIKVGKNYCGLLDCYLNYPTLGDIYLNYFMVDKAYHKFEIGKEIIRDFTCLALKEYNKVILDSRANQPNVIEFWNSLGFNVSSGISNLSIQRRDI